MKLSLTGDIWSLSHLGAALLLQFGALCRPVSAQIVPDATLPSNSQVTNNGTTFTIDGGTVRGSNHFHSFREFAIPTGTEAFFNNAATIENIITRVTGGEISNIDGLIRANGGANLFLLNPNGIVFGPHARLDLGGSFFASTADSMLFDDGSIYSATDRASQPLLTINVPIGLQWNRPVPAGVQVQQSTLEVRGRETIAIVGGNAELQNATIKAPGGRVELGGLAGPGRVEIMASEAVEFPTGVARADVFLSNGTQVDVAAGGNGSIAINANNLHLSGRSKLQAGLAADLGSQGAVAGNINLEVTGITTVTDGSVIANEVAPKAIGSGGSIVVDTGSLLLDGGARIQTVTHAPGAAGDIHINARETISISGFTADGLFSGILTRSARENSGTGGNITLNNRQGALNLDRRGFVAAVTNSSSNGGSIMVNTGNLSFWEGGQIISLTTGSGGAGDITVTAYSGANLIGTSADFISNPFDNVETFSLEAANFTTAANADVEESGTGGLPYVSVRRTPEQILVGNDILGNAEATFDFYEFATSSPETRVIIDIDNGRAASDRLAPGNIDTVILLFDRATGELLESNDDASTSRGGEGSLFSQDSYISTTIAEPGNYVIGVGGFDTVTSDDVPLQGKTPRLGDSYTLHVSVENPGNPSSATATPTIGSDKFNPNDRVNSGIISEAQGLGNAGNLLLETPVLRVGDGARVAANTLGSGNAGNITVRSDQIQIEGRSPDGRFRSGVLSQVRPGASGNGGLLTVEAQNLLLGDYGEINGSTFGVGVGGETRVNATESVQILGIGSSRIASESFSVGDGGNIAVATPILELRNGGRIITNGFGEGNSGDIAIDASERVTAILEVDSDSLTGMTTNSRGTGNAGSLRIDTGKLTIDGLFNVQIGSIAFGDGNGGNLEVRATESIALSSTGSEGLGANGIFASAFDGTGNGGSIRLRAPELVVSNGAIVTASNFQSRNLRPPGTGAAGNLQIAADAVLVENGSSLTVAANAGNRGNLTLNAGSVVLRNGSQITVEARGTANGGNLIVNSDNFAALSSSKVTANAITGDGGNISIRTQSIFLSPDSSITASSQLGVSGTVTLSTPEIDPSEGLVEPPKNPLDIESLLGKDFCEVSKDSEFVITGRGGIALNPGDYLTGETIRVGLVDPVIRDNTDESTSENRYRQSWRGVNNSSISRSSRVEDSGPIVEATGWIKHPDGTIELVAHLGAMTIPWWKPVDCQDLSEDN